MIEQIRLLDLMKLSEYFQVCFTCNFSVVALRPPASICETVRGLLRRVSQRASSREGKSYCLFSRDL